MTHLLFDNIWNGRSDLLETNRLIDDLPDHLMKELFLQYHKKHVQTEKLSFQALEESFLLEGMEDINICPNCGTQDSVDPELMKEVVVRHMHSKVPWMMVQQRLKYFKSQLHFGKEYSCTYGELNRHYHKYMGSLAITYRLDEFLEQHYFFLHGGRIYGLCLIAT